MDSISIATVLMSLQAVKKEIAYLEGLLRSETLSDGAEIQDLLLTYEDAERELRDLYIQKQKFAANSLSYESLSL
ncbi:hypothetical protein MAH1_02870 [Sessilibacter sp. MAH1]